MKVYHSPRRKVAFWWCLPTFKWKPKTYSCPCCVLFAIEWGNMLLRVRRSYHG